MLSFNVRPHATPKSGPNLGGRTSRAHLHKPAEIIAAIIAAHKARAQMLRRRWSVEHA